MLHGALHQHALEAAAGGAGTFAARRRRRAVGLGARGPTVGRSRPRLLLQCRRRAADRARGAPHGPCLDPAAPRGARSEARSTQRVRFVAAAASAPIRWPGRSVCAAARLGRRVWPSNSPPLALPR